MHIHTTHEHMYACAHAHAHTHTCTVLYLGQLFGNVTTHKDSLQVDPQVLHGHPVLNDLGRVGQVGHPQLNLLLEGGIVPAKATVYVLNTKKGGNNV